MHNSPTPFKVGETYKVRITGKLRHITVTAIRGQNRTQVVAWKDGGDVGVTAVQAISLA